MMYQRCGDMHHFLARHDSEVVILRENSPKSGEYTLEINPKVKEWFVNHAHLGLARWYEMAARPEFREPEDARRYGWLIVINTDDLAALFKLTWCAT